MGRPLKIKKSTTKDIGFNAVTTLTAPVYPATMQDSQFFGVVGGANASVATSTYPVVKCRVRITGQAEADGYIITQKGSTKYQVASVTAINDEDMVVGTTYRILTLGDTVWSKTGAGLTAAVGDVFTALGAGAGTGTVQLVGTCVLADELDTFLTAGNMNITMTADNSSAITISRLTNRFALDYSDPKVRYAVNFFTDGSTVIKSGTSGGANTASQQNQLVLTVVERFTS
jgi:hypothetical protein